MENIGNADKGAAALPHVGNGYDRSAVRSRLTKYVGRICWILRIRPTLYVLAVPAAEQP